MHAYIHMNTSIYNVYTYIYIYMYICTHTKVSRYRANQTLYKFSQRHIFHPALGVMKVTKKHN